MQSQTLMQAIALCLAENKDVHFRTVEAIGNPNKMDIVITLRELIHPRVDGKGSLVKQNNRIITAMDINQWGEGAWIMALDRLRETFPP